jgi:hypothetical protein
VIIVDVEFEIDGGTGRFDGAEGRGEMIAYVEFPGIEVPVWSASWEWEGFIKH